MRRGLAAVFVGGLLRRRAASALSVLAIALGVALGLAVQLINDAALAEFGRGMRTLAGDADLRLAGPASGFDDALFEAVALHPLVADASPVVDIEARVVGGDTTLRVLGVDVLRLPAVQPGLVPRADDGTADAPFAGIELVEAASTASSCRRRWPADWHAPPAKRWCCSRRPGRFASR